MTGKGGGTNVGGAPGTAGASGTAGSAGTGGTGGTGAGGAGNEGGGGMGGDQAGGNGGTVAPSDNGQTCAQDADCKSGHCADHTCCSTACSGVCLSCANSTGMCTPAAAMSDPRGDCAVTALSTCGSVGYCNGNGACAMAPAGTICNTTPTCDSTSTSVIVSSICNGAGACVPGPPWSCNGFLCASGACETTCSDDSGCVPGGFCSAQRCVVTPNLAGNGDLETGTLTGWSSFANGGPLFLSSPAASGSAHAGQYAIALSGRTRGYQGQGYALPTGVGTYNISAWVMQKEWASSVAGILTGVVSCRDLNPTSYYLNFASVSMPENTWVMVNGTLDLTTATTPSSDCGPATGLVRSAQLYLNQQSPCGADLGATMACPDLYMDDLVVTVTDGHNLIGNPSFEAGTFDGWRPAGGLSSKLQVTGTVAHGGQKSLSLMQRTTSTTAVAYALPIGAARYSASLWVLQNGTTDHQLALLPLYSCIGNPATSFAAPSAVVTAHAGEWTQVTGTFVFPPANAPAGCVLSQASVAMGQAETGTCGSTVECPDLFVDDASITLK